MARKASRLILVLLVVCATLPVGTIVQSKGPCICPKVYAPVQCSNGKIYPNQCVANCRHAKDCVPLGDIFQLQASTEAPACDRREAGEIDWSVELDETDEKQDIEVATP